MIRYLSRMTPRDPLYAGYRHVGALIVDAVWLHFRVAFSLRMVEEMLAVRVVLVIYEAIRQWGLKVCREFANRIRRRAPCSFDKWHLDEVVITVAGKKHWLWCAVDQDGFVLDVLVQSRRDKKAAKRLFGKLLKKQARASRVLITHRLRSYAAAGQKIMPGVEYRQLKSRDNWADNPHQPIQRPKRNMKRFKSPRRVQQFRSIHDQISNVFFRRPYQDTAAKVHSAYNETFTA